MAVVHEKRETPLPAPDKRTRAFSTKSSAVVYLLSLLLIFSVIDFSNKNILYFFDYTFQISCEIYLLYDFWVYIKCLLFTQVCINQLVIFVEVCVIQQAAGCLPVANFRMFSFALTSLFILADPKRSNHQTQYCTLISTVEDNAMCLISPVSFSSVNTNNLLTP